MKVKTQSLKNKKVNKQPIRKKITRNGHKLNWLPDLPDQRDYLFSKELKPLKKISLPNKVNLIPECSAVVNQGKIGSCTGNALAGGLEFLQLQQIKTPSTKDDTQVFNKNKFMKFSRLFIYYNERVIENTVNEDSGATLRDGIKSLCKWGACSEITWKYLNSNVFKKPSAASYKEAKTHIVNSYYRLESLDDMKQCLARGYPFVFGFAVYESFETEAVARTGIMPMPKYSERMLGGHAVMAVGYDDKKSYFIIRNSWGKDWGQDGYFLMPYAYISNGYLAQDFWTVRQ